MKVDPSDPVSYQNQSIVVDGMELSYVSAGSGRPVVLIHGNPGSFQDYTLAVVERLARSYHVLAFDRPGHGFSERHDSVSTTVEVQAQIIREALQRLDIEQPVLVGHSWGGSLVLAAAVAYANDLSGIVLLAPAAYPSVRVEWWSLVPHVPLVGKFVVNRLTPYLGRSIVRRSLKQAYDPQEVQHEYAERSAEMWMQPDHIRACAYDERTLRASLKSLSQHYGGIELPVVIVTGDVDRVLVPKEHAYPLHEAIEHSQLIVLQQTGHQLPQTKPDDVIAAVDLVWTAVSTTSVRAARFSGSRR